MSAPEEMTLKVIAHIRTAFPTKFGIPRQSGLVDSLRGEVIFTPEFRNDEAVRGLEDFSHIWLVWQFSVCTSTNDRGLSPLQSILRKQASVNQRIPPPCRSQPSDCLPSGCSAYQQKQTQ